MVLEQILPENLLNHFEIIELLILCDISTKKEIYHIKLDEKNNLPNGYDISEYESKKGFYLRKRFKTFPY